MEKIISRIRNKRLKGNVSLLVILILLASSVISLLSINQIQHLITYGNMTFNYFRAFYLAKAWNELALTEIYNRENWFQHTIKNEYIDDEIEFHELIKDNFLWPDNKYEGFNPYFDMEIVSRFGAIVDDVTIDGCEGNKIELKGKSAEDSVSWEGIVLQLFTDVTEGLSNILKSDSNIEKLGDIKKLKSNPTNLEWNLMFWLFGEDNEWNAEIIVKEWNNDDDHDEDYDNDLSLFLERNITSIDWTRRYLTIKNIWNEDVSFCIDRLDGKEIPYSHYVVTVRGNYADMEVWLQSVVKKDFPSWSLDLVEMTSSS